MEDYVAAVGDLAVHVIAESQRRRDVILALGGVASADKRRIDYGGGLR
jgi:hypothetical protein